MNQLDCACGSIESRKDMAMNKFRKPSIFEGESEL